MRSRFTFTLTAAALAVAVLAAPQAQAAVTRRVECSDVTSSECVLVTEYPIPPPPQYSTNPGGITAGPDGRMWFTENAGAAQGIGAISQTGQISQYTIPTGGSHPGTIVSGPDGRLWFSEDLTNKIGAVTTSGQFTEYSLPKGSVGPYDLAVGSDGRIWFTAEGTDPDGDDESYVGAMATSGQLTTYPVYALLGSLAEGSDGRIWFLDENGYIDAITTDGTITRYALPDDFHETADITAGPDSRIWVTNGGGVAAVTTTGSVGVLYESYVPLVGRQDRWASGAWEITAGPDGRLWYFDGGQELLSAMTPSGAQSGVFLPVGVDPNTAGLAALATAPSGAHHVAEGFGKLWFTDGYPDDEIGAVTLNAKRPAGCKVPKLIGLTVRTARKRLASRHCQLGLVTKKLSRKRAGRVIAQRLTPGSHHEYGTRVAVVVGERRARRSR